MSHYILDGWLRGTVCGQKAKRSVMFENETHIVLKHNAHAEYLGRSSGTQNCGSYARLYLKMTLEEHMKHSSYGGWNCHSLREWTGRINPRVVKAECADMGIKFS